MASEGGHVTYAHKFDSDAGIYDHAAELSSPQWLVDLIGIDFFDSVHSVILDNQEVDDLEPITNLTSLRSLAIVIEIDPQLDFSPLAELDKLEKVHLDYTRISAKQLADLRKMLPNARVDAMNHLPPP